MLQIFKSLESFIELTDCLLEMSNKTIFDLSLNFRPEYVAGVDDSPSRRWGTIEVSVPNLWKDNVGQNKDEETRRGAS